MEVEWIFEFDKELIMIIPVPLLVINKDLGGLLITWLGGYIGFKISKKVNK